MRILHVIAAIAGRDGGPSVVVRETVARLALRGHEVVIATTDADGRGRLSIPIGRETEINGVPVVAFRRRGGGGFKWSPGLAAWLERHTERFDVVDVHAVFSHSSVAAGRAARRAGVRYVVRPHGALDPWSLGRKSIGKRVLRALGVNALLAGADRMQYTTSAEQQLAERHSHGLPGGAVVPIGVADRFFDRRRTQAPWPPNVLVMGRIEPKKRIETLIAACHRVPAVELTVAGGGEPPYVHSLQRLAQGGPAAARIRFVGWVSGDEQLAAIDRATYVAMPSAQENFGLSLVEAMAGGVPALVTPEVNLAADIAKAGAGWIVAADVDAWVAQLDAIARDRSAREARGEAARVFAATYRWSHGIDRLVDLYADVRRGDRRRR